MVLKIGRSFVQKISGFDEDRALVTAVIDVAKALKLRVIAEGVETLEQLEFLAGLKCDEGQGSVVKLTCIRFKSTSARSNAAAALPLIRNAAEPYGEHEGNKSRTRRGLTLVTSGAFALTMPAGSLGETRLQKQTLTLPARGPAPKRAAAQWERRRSPPRRINPLPSRTRPPAQRRKDGRCERRFQDLANSAPARSR